LDEAVRIFEEASGKKFEVVHEDLESLQVAIENAPPQAKFVPRLKQILISHNSVGYIEHPDNAKYPFVKVTSLKDYAHSLYA
jgi:hypothetical protein